MRLVGDVAAGFDRVRKAFESNFARGDEVGASFVAIQRDSTIVDLSGGTAGRPGGLPWTPETIAPVSSAAKAFTAMCAAVLVDRGELDLDTPVARYWPEFAYAGKDNISVRWVLCHKSGVSAIDPPPSIDDFLQWDPVVEALARQPPLWEPGSRSGYHAFTYGHLVGEIVRRVSGRRPAQFLREEIAEPRGLDVWILLPRSEYNRLAETTRPSGPPPGAEPDALRAKIVATSRAYTEASPDQRLAIEHPSGGFATATGLAKFYAAVAGIGCEPIIRPETLATFTECHSDGDDLYVPVEVRWALGLMRPCAGAPGLRSASSFGHAGFGGALGFADPSASLAVGYVVNRFWSGLGGYDDPRSASLIDALYESLRR